MKKSTIAAAVLVLTLSGCTTDEPATTTTLAAVTTEAAAPVSSLPSLSDLYATCKLDGLRHVTLGDDGNLLTLELPQNSIATMTVTADESACVAVGLEIPDAVVAKIGATEPGDPSASESWENVTLTWKYSSEGDLTFIYEMAA